MRINLLPQPTGKELELLKKKKVVRLLSIFSLVATSVIVLILLGYSLLLLNEKAVVKRKIQEVEGEINRLADRESLLRGYKQKIQFLTQVFEKRQNFSSVLSDLWLIRPEGVGFSEITLTGNQVAVSGNALSKDSVSQFVNQIGQIRSLGEKEVTKVILNSVVLDKTGVYRFSIQVKLKS